MSGFAAVVLAAGQGRRFRASGGREPTKLLATLKDVPLVRHAVEAALGSRATPVILVTGHADAAVRAAVADLPLRVVHNADHAAGLAGSLGTGIGAVPPACAGAVVMLADMPGVGTPIVDALLAHAAAWPDADAVVPVFEGRRGNPVLLRRVLFAAVARLRGDSGARHLLRDLAVRVVELPLPRRGILEDVDLPEQLRRMQDDAGPPFTIC